MISVAETEQWLLLSVHELVKQNKKTYKVKLVKEVVKRTVKQSFNTWMMIDLMNMNDNTHDAGVVQRRCFDDMVY